MPGQIRFRKAVFETRDGKKYEVHDGIINEQDKSLQLGQYQVTAEYAFSEIDALRYSTSSLNLAGMLTGGGIGVITAVCLGGKNNSGTSSPFAFSTTATDEKVLLSIILTPLCAYIGYKIGDHFYINWQEYDLGAFKQSAAAGNRYAGLMLKIPLR